MRSTCLAIVYNLLNEVGFLFPYFEVRVPILLMSSCVNGAANDLFTLTSLIHSTSARGHMYKRFPHCNRVDLCTSISSHSA